MTSNDALGARLMARFEPFEPSPLIAIGVSGGADSLALTLLAHDWATFRGGRVLALTVDHGLRADSSSEAEQVGRWLSARGIAHEILRWEGAKPTTGIQAAARAARLALLGERCRRDGILHLLLAHHRGDQAETVSIRMEDRSGADGLAGIASEGPTRWGRILRPLLGEPKATLVGFLEAAGQPWIEDPSNRDERHARVRLRRRISEDGSEAALASTARANGIARASRERAVADILARHVVGDADGWARLSAALLDEPRDRAQAALARVIMSIGDLDYPPRGERLSALVDHLARDPSRARTLGGCRIVPDGAGWLVVRESSSLPPEVSFINGTAQWDRFTVLLPACVDGSGLRVGALGNALTSKEVKTPPAIVRQALPAVRDLDGVIAVPHLGWVRPGADMRLKGASSWIFPRQALAQAEFAVA